MGSVIKEYHTLLTQIAEHRRAVHAWVDEYHDAAAWAVVQDVVHEIAQGADADHDAEATSALACCGCKHEGSSRSENPCWSCSVGRPNNYEPKEES